MPDPVFANLDVCFDESDLDFVSTCSYRKEYCGAGERVQRLRHMWSLSIARCGPETRKERKKKARGRKCSRTVCQIRSHSSGAEKKSERVAWTGVIRRNASDQGGWRGHLRAARTGPAELPGDAPASVRASCQEDGRWRKGRPFGGHTEWHSHSGE